MHFAQRICYVFRMIAIINRDYFEGSYIPEYDAVDW